MAQDKHWNNSNEYLKMRCRESGLLFAGGLTFAFISLQFDRSVNSPAIWGIYAMVAGFVGSVVYNFRLLLHRTRLLLDRIVHRDKAQQTDLTAVIFNGGIR